ncbi:hypothetical protein Taro_017241, partial [Colocasia esculenta]|nr:hypothetical protein [Colocasia esculenta]
AAVRVADPVRNQFHMKCASGKAKIVDATVTLPRLVTVAMLEAAPEVKCALQFRVCYMSFGEPQSCWTNEPLILWRFSGECRIIMGLLTATEKFGDVFISSPKRSPTGPNR